MEGDGGHLTLVDFFPFLFFFSLSLLSLCFFRFLKKEAFSCVEFISLIFAFFFVCPHTSISCSFSFLLFVAHRVLFGLFFCLLALGPIHSLDLLLFLFLFGIIPDRFSFDPGHGTNVRIPTSAARCTSY